MANIQNVRIGACSVSLGGVDLGHTKGGVTFRYQRNIQDLTVDQYGDSPVEKALTGVMLEIEVPLAEINLSNLNVAIPEGEHAQAGSGGSLKERLGIGTDAGYLLGTDAKQLILHPLNKSASDLSEDITVYKAVSNDETELGFKVDDQRVITVKFAALITETYGSGRRFGHIGYANIS